MNQFLIFIHYIYISIIIIFIIPSYFLFLWQRLEQELEEAKQVAVCLDDQSKDNEVYLNGLKSFVEK